MSTESWITIGAIIIGPIAALMVQRGLDHLRERRHRRVVVFRSLMATRASTVSPLHVEALNSIDVEFYGWWPSHKRVTAAWKALRNHLSDSSFKGDPAAWNRRALDLRVELLHVMSHAVGYKFDKDDIQRNIYVPGAHDEIEDDQRLIRKGVVELLTGKRGLSTLTWLMPPQAPYPVQMAEKAETTALAVQEPPEQKQPLQEEVPQKVEQQ